MKYGYKRGFIDGMTFWPFPCVVPSSMWEPRRNKEWGRGYTHGVFSMLAAFLIACIWSLS